MMISTKIKCIKSKIDSALLFLRNMEHFFNITSILYNIHFEMMSVGYYYTVTLLLWAARLKLGLVV